MNGFARIWTAELLAWRLRSPRTHYSVRSDATAKTLLSATKYPGLRAVLARVSDSTLARTLDGLPRARASPNVWLGLDSGIDWRRCAYVPVPMRFRPSPLNLIFRWLARGAERLDRGEVKFEGLDFDAF